MKIILQFILILFIGYNAFHWYAKVQSETNNTKVTKEVVFVGCNSTKGSKIQIKHKFKNLTIEIPRDICRKISKGDKIDLIYDETINQFHYYGSNSFRNVSIFLMVIFGLSFIDYNKIRK